MFSRDKPNSRCDVSTSIFVFWFPALPALYPSEAFDKTDGLIALEVRPSRAS